MPTFTQAILLGAERLNAAPALAHASVGEAWARLDWMGAKEVALLEASALIGSARRAGALADAAGPALDAAPAESLPVAPPRAIALLRQLFAEDSRVLLPEWIEFCARAGLRVPPFFLPTLFEAITEPGERALLARIVGERGPWLARQNPPWAWVVAAAPRPADASLWETGTQEERLGLFRQLRTSTPAQAVELLTKTWSEDPPEFRVAALALLGPTPLPVDESLLTRALGDKRKEVRSTAQGLLAALPNSGLVARMRARAENLLALQRGLLSRKWEIHLPAAFDAAWKADAIEEKPPPGVGEKAWWTQQILSLIPIAYWVEKYDLEAGDLIRLAAKSNEWGDLLLGAWFRAACLHRDAAASAALIRPLLERPKLLPGGITGLAGIASLLASCNESERWRLVSIEADIAWVALPLLTGTPSAAESRALFENLWRAIRDGFNPGGAPGAVLAARRLRPELRDEAARRLERENGLSKPAEAFLHALELRAELHAAFSHPTPTPSRL